MTVEQAPILTTTRLCKYYGQLKAVDTVTLAVQSGEIFGLLGPNGAGKTTLLKILSTLLPATLGEASISDVDLLTHPAQVRELIGYVPQLISADGNLTGYENLWLFAKLYDIPAAERKSRVQEALTLVGLAEASHRYVREYSGGMMRRLEIVQAILHRPKILLLDEPTTGLDPAARRVVWNHLKRVLIDYDMTIILTTHDMEEADQLCDRIAIMNRGQVVTMGSPKELKQGLHLHATLADVFIHFTGDALETNNRENYDDIKRQRKDAYKRGS